MAKFRKKPVEIVHESNLMAAIARLEAGSPVGEIHDPGTPVHDSALWLLQVALGEHRGRGCQSGDCPGVLTAQFILGDD